MTLINNTHGFIFIHVPKNAGTAIATHLSRLTRWNDLEVGGTRFGHKIQGAYTERFGISKHSSAREVREAVGSDVWSRYFTFAFVRNPFARAVSTFNFLRTWQQRDRHPPEIDAVAGMAFDEFIGSRYWGSDAFDRILLPQAFWITGDDGAVMVDHVARVENLLNELTTLFVRLRIAEKSVTPPKRNVSRAFVQIPISKEAAEAIRESYAADFALFGYSLDMPCELLPD